MKNKKINHDLFITSFTPESSYILGFLWADGYISKRTNSISLECISEDINNIFPLFIKTGTYNLYHRNRKNRQPQSTINCSSFELASFLKENDYLDKSSVAPIKILSKIPNELKKYFFLGWSDGDGCFYIKEKQMSGCQFIMSGTYDQDWISLITLCSDLNINYQIDKFITGKGHRYSRFLISKNKDIIKLGEYFYTQLDIGLTRKRIKFNMLKTHIMSIPTTKISCYNLMNVLIKEFDSLKSASEWLNKKRNVSSDILEACIGSQKTAFNYIWTKSLVYQ